MEVVAKQLARTNIDFRKTERELDLHLLGDLQGQIVILEKKKEKWNYLLNNVQLQILEKKKGKRR